MFSTAPVSIEESNIALYLTASSTWYWKKKCRRKRNHHLISKIILFADESNYLKSNNQDFHNQLQSLHNTQICNLATSMYPCHTNRTNLTSFCWTKGWCKHSWTLWLRRCVERSADCAHQPNITRKHFIGSKKVILDFKFYPIKIIRKKSNNFRTLQMLSCWFCNF